MGGRRPRQWSDARENRRRGRMETPGFVSRVRGFDFFKPAPSRAHASAKDSAIWWRGSHGPSTVAHRCLFERRLGPVEKEFWPALFATFAVCSVRVVLSTLQVVNIFALLFKGVFYGGLYLVFLKRLRNQPTRMAEAFRALVKILSSCCWWGS